MGGSNSKDKTNQLSDVSVSSLPRATAVMTEEYNVSSTSNKTTQRITISEYLTNIENFAETSLEYETRFRSLGLRSIKAIADQLQDEEMTYNILKLFDNIVDLKYFLDALINDNFISRDIAASLKTKFNKIKVNSTTAPTKTSSVYKLPQDNSNATISSNVISSDLKNNEVKQMSFSQETINKGNELIKQKEDYALFTTLANKDKPEIANYIISLNNSIINKIDADGCYPIHRAAANGQVDIVKYILSVNDKQINITNNKWSPLIYAAYYNKTEVVKLLLKYKEIDINLKDNLNKTALDYAKVKQNNEMIFFLINHKV